MNGRKKQAALADFEDVERSLRGISKRTIGKAYDKLIRDARRYESGNYTRGRVDGLRRSKGFGGGVPRGDDYSKNLERCDREITDGLATIHTGAARVRAALKQVSDLTGPLVDGDRFYCVGFGKHEAHWEVGSPTHRDLQFCKDAYNAYDYWRRTQTTEPVDSEVFA